MVSVAGGAGESCAVSVGDTVGAGAAGVLAAGRGGVCGRFFRAGLWSLAAALLGGAGVVFSDGRYCLCEPVLSVAEPGDAGGLAGNRTDAGVSGTDAAGWFDSYGPMLWESRGCSRSRFDRRGLRRHCGGCC